MRTIEEVISTVRGWQQQRAEQFAAARQARFERGELRGLTLSDGRRIDRGALDFEDSPLSVLEAEARGSFRSDAEGLAYLSASPSRQATWDEAASIQANAGEALAYDALRIARARGWCRARRGEEPSAADLRAGVVVRSDARA